MTYRVLEPWISEEDLVLTKTLGERIRYVRENLVDERGVAMTQAALAEYLGLAKGHHGVGSWEAHGREPRPAIRRKIAALTDGAYRAELFSRAGAEVLVVQSAVPRLQELEAALNELGPRLEKQIGALARRADALGRRAPAKKRPAGSGT